jgi:hypothetical protein
MDAEGLRDAWRETVRAVLRGDGTRVLWDLTGASVEMSAQDWARLAADDGPRAMFSVPVGILVLEKHLRDVYAYADALNCHGKNLPRLRPKAGCAGVAAFYRGA